MDGETGRRSDANHTWIRIQRGICKHCDRTLTMLPDWFVPGGHYSLTALTLGEVGYEVDRVDSGGWRAYVRLNSGGVEGQPGTGGILLVQRPDATGDGTILVKMD